MAEKIGSDEERENAFAQINYLQQVYTERYNAVTREINNLLESLQEMTNALGSMSAADKIKNKATMMHVGADIYVEGKVGGMDKAIVGVGGNYLVEKDVEEAKLFINARIERYNKFLQSILKEKEELEAALLDVSYKMQELAQG